MKIVVNAQLQKTSVAVGLVVASMVASVTAVDGSIHTKTLDGSEFLTKSYDFNKDYQTVTLTFEDSDGVPPGPFTGSLVMQGIDGQPVGSPVSFTSPENDQYQISVVTVSLV